MSHWKRLHFAAGLTVVVGGVLIVVLAIAAPDSMVSFITEPYWVGIFVLSYVVAPLVGRYIKAS